MATIRENALLVPPCPPVATVADETVQATAEARLRRSAYYELRRVRCEFSDGVLMLRGYVPSYYLKQLAQHVVRGLEGVAAIDNRLHVDRSGAAWASAARP